jgi:predicted DNA-binding transcriptional regulator AlpA
MPRRTNRSNTTKPVTYSATRVTYSATQPTYSATDRKPRRVLRLPDVIAKTGMSKSMIYQKINLGLFPAPGHLLSSKVSVWDEAEIDAVLEAAFTGRNEATAQ